MPTTRQNLLHRLVGSIARKNDREIRMYSEIIKTLIEEDETNQSTSSILGPSPTSAEEGSSNGVSEGVDGP